MRNVENMRSMFEGCSNLEELSDTSHWNLENVFGSFSCQVFLERIDSFSFFGSETLFCYQITMTSKMRNFIAKRLSESILSSRLFGMKVLGTASTIVI